MTSGLLLYHVRTIYIQHNADRLSRLVCITNLINTQIKKVNEQKAACALGKELKNRP